jgi:hypothetical protein
MTEGECPVAVDRSKSDERTLNRLWKVKHREPPKAATIGADMLSFFKNSVQKRQGKMAAIAECWQQLVPAILVEHCCLESFHAGTLKVIVDSSPHLYELKQLLLSGLEKQLQLACKSSGLRKVTLKPGRWYEGDGAARKIRFG